MLIEKLMLKTELEKQNFENSFKKYIRKFSEISYIDFSLILLKIKSIKELSRFIKFFFDIYNNI